MANEFIARKGLIALNNTQITGSLSVSSTLSIPGFTNVSASLAAAVAGGDNLGNHTATQNLNMDSYPITNVTSITGSNSAAIEIGDYNFGYEVTAGYPVTGSGIIIRKSGIPANNHPMLKIGDVELMDITPVFESPVFLIRNVDRFLVTSGSEPANIYDDFSTKLFEHDGDAFKINIGGDTSPVFTLDSASGLVVNTSLTTQRINAGASVGTISYMAGWIGIPSTPTSEIQYQSLDTAVSASAASSGFGSEVTINNNTDNRIITATGTANTLNGEANFTINSGELNVSANGFITFAPGDSGRKPGIYYDVDGELESTSTLFAGTTVKVGGGISTVAGKIYNLSGSWAEADAKQANTSTGFLGIALNAGTTNTFLKEGIFSLQDSDIGGSFIAGAPLYLSTTTGAISFNPPTSNGEIVRIVGHALDSYTSGTTWIKIFFNPSHEWIELN